PPISHLPSPISDLRSPPPIPLTDSPPANSESSPPAGNSDSIPTLFGNAPAPWLVGAVDSRTNSPRRNAPKPHSHPSAISPASSRTLPPHRSGNLPSTTPPQN